MENLTMQKESKLWKVLKPTASQLKPKLVI